MDIVYRVYESYANKIVTDTKWEQTTKASSTIEETKPQLQKIIRKRKPRKAAKQLLNRIQINKQRKRRRRLLKQRGR